MIERKSYEPGPLAPLAPLPEKEAREILLRLWTGVEIDGLVAVPVTGKQAKVA